jgi:hypothetical protein
MNNKQLAAHLGLSPNTTKKYPADKRQQLITDIKAGVKPSVHRLIAELASECYRAACYIGKHVNLDTYYAPTGGHFCVSYQQAGDDKLTYLVEPFTAINAVNLSGAIVKVQELCE